MSSAALNHTTIAVGLLLLVMVTQLVSLVITIREAYTAWKFSNRFHRASALRKEANRTKRVIYRAPRQDQYRVSKPFYGGPQRASVVEDSTLSLAYEAGWQ